MTKKKETGAEAPKKPLTLDDIKKAIKKGDEKELRRDRGKMMQALGMLSQAIQNDIQQKIGEEVMPKVNDYVNKFCDDNKVTVAGFYDFSKISATVVNTTQYAEFLNEIRRAAPVPNWELFEKLQQGLSKELNAMIIGIFDPNSFKPNWTIKTKPDPELHKAFKEVMGLVEELKAIFKKYDEADAMNSAEALSGEDLLIPENK